MKGQKWLISCIKKYRKNIVISSGIAIFSDVSKQCNKLLLKYIAKKNAHPCLRSPITNWGLPAAAQRKKFLCSTSSNSRKFPCWRQGCKVPAISSWHSLMAQYFEGSHDVYGNPRPCTFCFFDAAKWHILLFIATPASPPLHSENNIVLAQFWIMSFQWKILLIGGELEVSHFPFLDNIIISMFCTLSVQDRPLCPITPGIQPHRWHHK